MSSHLQEAINASRRAEVQFKQQQPNNNSLGDSLLLSDGDLSTKSFDPSSSTLNKLRRVASESENSMFFQSRVQATVAKPFISKLTHSCVTQDDFTRDLSFNKWSGEVALLFIDITGYSKLAAALPGAHALAEAVNGYFTPIVDIIVAAQGDVLKFAGDAIMVVWRIGPSRPCIVSCIFAALGCALELQKKAGSYEVPSVPGTQLRLHIGCAANRMDADVMMPPATNKRVMQQAFFFVGGPVLSGLEEIVDSSPPGCVAVSRSIGDYVPLENLKTTDAPDTDGRILIVEAIDRPIASPAPPKPTTSENRSVSRLSCNDVSADFDEEAELHEQLDNELEEATGVDDYFVPPDVLMRLRMGLRTEDMAEMRDLVCLFIKKTGTMDTTDWFEEVYDVLNGGRCPITQIIEDDKGVHVIASMNLYVSEDGAADAAVRLAQRLVDLEISCIVGIAAGLCFCGIVGSEKIHRWDITGAACVRACRLVQFAAANNVLVAVDKSVVEKMGDAACVRKYNHEAVLKGASEPVPVFIVATNLDSPLSTIAAINEFTVEVHADKREQLRQQLIHQSDIVCGAALVVGGRMSGKKYLLLSALNGTPFVPIIHRVPRGCQRLDVLRTIARWFKYHHNPILRDLAHSVCSSLRQRHTSQALLVCLDLIHTCIHHGEHVAMVIDRAQFIDDASLRLIARCTRGEFCLDRQHEQKRSSLFATQDQALPKKGRWVWLMSMTPQLQGQKLKNIHQIANLSLPPIKIGKIGLSELGAIFKTFTFWDYWVGNGNMELDICDGLPGAYWNQLTVVGPQLFMRMMGVMRGRFNVQEAGMAIGNNGRIIAGDFPESVFRMVTFRKSCPQLLATHIQTLDVMHPRQQLVLKVLASIQHRLPMKRWTWKQVCHIAVVFIPRTSIDMLLHDMLIMKEIMVLEVDDKSEDGEVRFVDHSMAEAVFETLTPGQLSQVCKKAIKAIVVSFTGNLSDLDNDSVEALFLLASRVEGAEGREQRNAFGKQLLRRHLTTTPPKTVPTTGSLYDAIDHRLAWHCECLGIDASELAVEYPIHTDPTTPKPNPTELVAPAYLPHRTMDVSSDSTIPLSIARAKSMEPPIIIGPITGLFMALVHRMIGNHMVGRGGSERTHIPPATGAEYLRMVDKFESAVGADPSLSKTWREEEAALIERMESPTPTTANLGSICGEAVNWVETVISSRVSRITTFASSLQALRPVNEEDRVACAGLLRAFDFIKHVNESTDPETLPEVTSNCLMSLAISNWSSPYSYMVPAKLREMWLAGWLSTQGIKGILFMFILEKCKGKLSLTRVADA